MWFGTQDGLNRYDGYTFQVYKHKPDDPTSLSENWIWSIYEDSSGYLWVATFGGGACRFDPKAERFVTFRHEPAISGSLSHDTVWSFYETPHGTIWIGANDGLNKLDPETGSFSYYKPSTAAPNVFRIVPGAPGFLWVLTPDGLHSFDIRHETFEHYPANEASASGLGSVIRSLAKGRSGLFWLGTTDTGLNRFDARTKTVIRYKHHTKAPGRGPASNFISAVYEDSRSVVWAGTRKHGLSLLKFDGEDLRQVQNVIHDPFDATSLSHNYIFSIYESPAGQVWVGTRDGLNRFDRYNQKFSLYQASTNQGNGLSHNNVLPIFASRKSKGVVWVGTYDGLNKLDQKTGRITQYKSDPRKPDGSLSSSYILSLHEDRSGRLWVGTRGGLTRVSVDAAGKERFTSYRYNPGDEKSLSNDAVHCIYQDRSGILWVGTGGGGLCRFDEQNETFARIPHDAARTDRLNDPFVFALLEDRTGCFWVGTAADGLNLLDRQNGSVRHYRHDPANRFSLSNNRVLCMTETRSGDIWVGTAAGLNKLVSPTTPDGNFSFIQFHEADGLPNEVIYGILEDDAGHLWMSTNRGLAKVTPGPDGLKVRTYTKADGLQSYEFNHNASHKDSDGRMYFGGVNGLNVFHPDSVKDNPYIPPVVITDYSVLNVTRPFSEKTEIVLTYHDYFFSFQFAALNYTMPEKNQYAYMMEGFDHDWIYCGSRRFASYTNLDPGSYRFRVKASNNDGIWNEEGTSIKVTITPPPWQTWWAYVLYILAFLGSIGGFVRHKVRSAAKAVAAEAAIEHAKMEERERVRRNSAADFHDEAGHLITKITLFLELAKRKVGPDFNIAEYLGKIEENTKALSSGMRDFIWGLDPEKDTLHDTLLRLSDFGGNLFQHSEIRFQAMGLDPAFKQVDLSIDQRRSIMFIFKEAMNNCLKYSQAHSSYLQVDLSRAKLTILFTDDGTGFEPMNPTQSYGLKNMVARAEKVGARLDIATAIGSGTQIRFTRDIDWPE